MNWFSRPARRRGRRPLRVVAVAAVASLVAVGAATAVTSRSSVAPANSSPPTISGTVTVGSTLTANPGTWTGSAPISFQYQWVICDGNGNACHDISGATAQTYQLNSTELGDTVRVRVIGSNTDGSSSATSGASAKVAAAAGPANTSPPTISGNVTVGSTVTASPGAWSGTAPISFQYQWVICDGNGNACHDISGATAQTYQVKSSDLGNTLRIRVIASNADGSSSTTSSPSATVASAPPPPNGCPTLSTGAQAVSVTDVSPPARLQVDQFQLASGPITTATTTFSVRFHVADTCGHAVSGALVYATAVPYGQVTVPGEATTDATGSVTLTYNRLLGFAASRRQRLLVMFVRARRAGDPLLAGISTRRLVSLRINPQR